MSHTSRALALLALASTLAVSALLSNADWTLPVPDGGGTHPSPPSIQGYISAVALGSLTLRPDRCEGKPIEAVTMQLILETKFFSGYGGLYEPTQLRAGQYVWVWYITEDPKKAGTPPRAAVVMLWSLDPKDKPAENIRWHWHDRK